MHRLLAGLVLILVVSLICGTTPGVYAQDGGSIAPPAGTNLAPPEQPPAVPLPEGPPPGAQITTPLDVDLSQLENILGPIPVFRCSVSAISAFPIMQCAEDAEP